MDTIFLNGIEVVGQSTNLAVFYSILKTNDEQKIKNYQRPKQNKKSLQTSPNFSIASQEEVSLYLRAKFVEKSLMNSQRRAPAPPPYFAEIL
jgi:hypothetical protein